MKRRSPTLIITQYWHVVGAISTDDASFLLKHERGVFERVAGECTSRSKCSTSISRRIDEHLEECKRRFEKLDSKDIEYISNLLNEELKSMLSLISSKSKCLTGSYYLQHFGEPSFFDN